jgi:hypothetical protein
LHSPGDDDFLSTTLRSDPFQNLQTKSNANGKQGWEKTKKKKNDLEFKPKNHLFLTVFWSFACLFAGFLLFY